jgi:hypothetical protein
MWGAVVVAEVSKPSADHSARAELTKCNAGSRINEDGRNLQPLVPLLLPPHTHPSPLYKMVHLPARDLDVISDAVDNGEKAYYLFSG